MLKSLYAKLSVSLALLFIMVGILYTCLSFYSTSNYLQQVGQELNMDLAKNLVTDRNLVDKGQLDEKALSDTFMAYMTINPSIELYLLDKNGLILSYSAEPGKVKRHSVSLLPINRFLNKEKLPLLGDDPRSHEKKKVFSVTPIPNKDNIEGYLYIILHGEQYDGVENLIKDSLQWKQAGMTLIASLLMGFILALFIFYKLTSRLNGLVKNVDKFCSNDFVQFEPSTSIEQKKSYDEIDQLEHSFEQMEHRLLEQMDQLKQQDGLRRELVANVSHDLRTPMAILHGYLETLSLKVDTITPEQQVHYINQALRSSDRLTVLISQLFELAKLEAQEAKPDKDECDLTDLVHDAVQKFQIKASEKNIALTLRAKNNTLFAYVDIGLIARVIDNVLDNAIKFTPELGRIDVYLSEEKEAITLQIKNSGKGISTHDLPNVFDRFYQGNNGRQYQSSGLGLAISKRIMELHSGELLAVSTLNKETVFTLKLPNKSKKTG